SIIRFSSRTSIASVTPVGSGASIGPWPRRPPVSAGCAPTFHDGEDSPKGQDSPPRQGRSMSNVGVIGLGIMGQPIAANLIKGGHTVYLHSRSGVPSDLIALGGRGCSSGQEVAKSADIVVTMVPDTPDVERVLFGTAGVASGLTPGKVVIDMS